MSCRGIKAVEIRTWTHLFILMFCKFGACHLSCIRVNTQLSYYIQKSLNATWTTRRNIVLWCSWRCEHAWVSRSWPCSGKYWHTAYFTPNILNYFIKRCYEIFEILRIKCKVKQPSWEVILANYKSSLPVNHFERWVANALEINFF